ncbi:MAG: bile acid:sodium symporter [Massilia sp.]|jgi:sodium/bile acid cotransporter 7|nr:bile acid:sodium symporter [Massilia sp.]
MPPSPPSPPRYALLRALIPDLFTTALMLAMVAATFWPASGGGARVLGHVTTVAIGLLFFLHGAKLSGEAVRAGFAHWRLHLLVLACTFVMFPLLGLLLKPLALALLTPELYLGLLFLCALPSTLQSSIAFTALARGNVAAAVCSASASNFIGIFVTPVLVGMLLLHGAGGQQSSTAAIFSFAQQLLLPFVAGQFARRWIGPWVDRNKLMLRNVDQGSILLVVYAAFSEAVGQGLWHNLTPAMLFKVGVVSCVLLALAMFGAAFASRRLGFSKEDQIAVVFCGSKKSMASGVPMAKVLFAASSLGVLIVPMMLFHQIQLMVCAALAQHYGKRID